MIGFDLFFFLMACVDRAHVQLDDANRVAIRAVRLARQFPDRQEYMEAANAALALAEAKRKVWLGGLGAMIKLCSFHQREAMTHA